MILKVMNQSITQPLVISSFSPFEIKAIFGDILGKNTGETPAAGFNSTTEDLESIPPANLAELGNKKGWRQLCRLSLSTFQQKKLSCPAFGSCGQSEPMALYVVVILFPCSCLLRPWVHGFYPEDCLQCFSCWCDSHGHFHTFKIHSCCFEVAGLHLEFL